MSPFISDDLWQQALILANADVSLESQMSTTSRQRIEAACSFLRANTYRTNKSLSFEDAAEAGQDFLAGCMMADEFLSWLRMLDPDSTPAHKSEFDLDNEFWGKAIGAIKELKNLGEVVARFNKANPQKVGGRNSKPYLHSAVGIAHEVWLNLKGSSRYKRKEFLSFAHLCLASARANVTENAVAESFDRHVRPRHRAAEFHK